MATEAQTCATGIFPNPACRGVASGEAGSSLASLHLSRTLYKSTLFMQNKPNFRKAKMNVSIVKTMNYKNFIPLAGQKNKPNSNPIKPNFRKAKMNVNLTLTKDCRKKDDFEVRKNKPKTNPISEKPKMSANLFTTKDYENEPLSGSKKTNPIKPNFRQEMLKKALSTCLRKAPLRRHRQSYSTWNLLFRPDRRPPHLQPATDTLRNRSAYTINTACYPAAFRLFLISSVSLRLHSGHLSGKSLGTVPLKKTRPQSGFIHFSALKTLFSLHFSQIIGGAVGAIGLAFSSTYLKYAFLPVWYSALHAGLLHLAQIISASEMLSTVSPPPPPVPQKIAPAAPRHTTITIIIIGFFLLSSISISPKQLN